MLPHVGVFQPLKKLIAASSRSSAADPQVGRALVNTLSTIGARLQRFPHNVDLFIEVREVFSAEEADEH